MVSLSFGGPSGSLEGLFHALECYFRFLHDEIYVGAFLRLAEAPSCPPARLWHEVASCFQARHPRSQRPRFSVELRVSLGHHVRSRLVLLACRPDPCRACVPVFGALPVGLIPSLRKQLLLEVAICVVATIIPLEACILVSALSYSFLLASRRGQF